jgi:LEA14-like dessication related protein
MKKSIKIIIAASMLLWMSGCDVVKQLGQAYNFTQCTYDYNSLSGLRIAGIDLSQGISLMDAPRIIGMFTGQQTSLPLDFVVNVDVANPNTAVAAMEGVQYILSIDNMEFTRGAIPGAVSVPAGGKTVMPLAFSIDLMSLMKSGSRDAVTGVVKNFIGMNDQKSNVSLKIKPSFRIANRTVEAPAYIPVNFAFGGKQK